MENSLRILLVFMAVRRHNLLDRQSPNLRGGLVHLV